MLFWEGVIGQKLLSQVRRDLSDVVKVCEGALKKTNHLRALTSALIRGSLYSLLSSRNELRHGPATIPDHWRKYKVHKAMSVSEWIPNLSRRLRIGRLEQFEVWLGGLFFPETYVTATRQAVAHRKKWNFGTLHLQLDLEKVNDPEAFIIDGEAFAIRVPMHRIPTTSVFVFQD